MTNAPRHIRKRITLNGLRVTSGREAAVPIAGFLLPGGHFSSDKKVAFFYFPGEVRLYGIRHVDGRPQTETSKKKHEQLQ